jgi:hypothetical protein
VRPLIIDTLLHMLNAQVYPAVPEQGSLGASGDLPPLAHLLLVLCQAPVAQAGDPALQLDTADGEAFVPSSNGRSHSGASLFGRWFNKQSTGRPRPVCFVPRSR